jgi:uncharacterized protein
LGEEILVVIKMPIGNIYFKIKKTYLKLIHINASPHQIAMGFAAGVFIGIFPTFGLGGLLAVGICFLLRFNIISTVIGSFVIMNPLTSPFFWSLSAVVGALVFQKEPSYIIKIIKENGFMHSVPDILLIYITGNLIVSFVTAIAFYFILKAVVTSYRLKKAQEIH